MLVYLCPHALSGCRCSSLRSAAQALEVREALELACRRCYICVLILLYRCVLILLHIAPYSAAEALEVCGASARVRGAAGY
jgi:hypothetical protein